MTASMYTLIGVLLAVKILIHGFAVGINADEGNFGNAGFNGFMAAMTALLFAIFCIVRYHS